MVGYVVIVPEMYILFNIAYTSIIYNISKRYCHKITIQRIKKRRKKEKKRKKIRTKIKDIFTENIINQNNSKWSFNRIVEKPYFSN